MCKRLSLNNIHYYKVSFIKISLQKFRESIGFTKEITK